MNYLLLSINATASLTPIGEVTIMKIAKPLYGLRSIGIVIVFRSLGLNGVFNVNSPTYISSTFPHSQADNIH